MSDFLIFIVLVVISAIIFSIIESIFVYISKVIILKIEKKKNAKLEQKKFGCEVQLDKTWTRPKRKETFSDGEIILHNVYGIYNPDRYHSKGRVYPYNVQTGEDSDGIGAFNIIKFNPDFLGKKVKE